MLLNEITLGFFKDFEWRYQWVDNAVHKSHGLLTKILSARHGIFSNDLLVRKVPLDPSNNTGYCFWLLPIAR